MLRKCKIYTYHLYSNVLKTYSECEQHLRMFVYALLISLQLHFHALRCSQRITPSDPLEKEFADERLKFLSRDREQVLKRLDDVASFLSSKGDPGSGFPALKPEGIYIQKDINKRLC